MTQNPRKLDHHLYGYCIGDNLEFRISPALLVNTLTGISIRLRPTMARLLSYILNHSNERMIEDEKIMRMFLRIMASSVTSSGCGRPLTR